MNRREFMKTAVAVAATIGVGGVVEAAIVPLDIDLGTAFASVQVGALPGAAPIAGHIWGKVIKVMQNGDVFVDGVKRYIEKQAEGMSFVATETLEWEMPDNPVTITNALSGFDGPRNYWLSSDITT